MKITIVVTHCVQILYCIHCCNLKVRIAVLMALMRGKVFIIHFKPLAVCTI